MTTLSANVIYDEKGCPCDRLGHAQGLSFVLHVGSTRLIAIARASDTVSKLKQRIAREAKQSHGIELMPNTLAIVVCESLELLGLQGETVPAPVAASALGMPNGAHVGDLCASTKGEQLSGSARRTHVSP